LNNSVINHAGLETIYAYSQFCGESPQVALLHPWGRVSEIQSIKEVALLDCA